MKVYVANMKFSQTKISNSAELDHKASTSQHTAVAMDGSEPTPAYTVMSEKKKIFTIIIASSINMVAFFAAGVYYPALNPLSEALGVSKVKINLTVTSYMLAQGLTPLLTGNLSDQYGRRPVLLLCLLATLGVNVALACQTNFVALTVLRCLQSFGGSGAVSVAGGTIVDVIARSERGKYMAYTSIGWRSIFWFLAILAGIMVVVIGIFQPETCRAVVGNGSLPPQPWNRPLLCPEQTSSPDVETRTTFSKRPSIWDSLKLLLDKQAGPLTLFSSMVNWGTMAVMISIPMLMEEKYHFNTLTIGLCYLPYAVGGITARWTVGLLADWNFRRHGRQMGVNIEKNRQGKEQLLLLPLEKIRLQIALPAIYCASLFLLGYSWVLAYQVHPSGPLIMLFFLGNAATGVTNTAGALIMDLHAYRPGMARAAMLLCRFIPGAGVVAIVPLLIQKIGIGWLGTIIAGLWLMSSSMLWVVYAKGQKWRQHRE
ncbi:hypothetical protein FE257_008218 [Aspergillus nanangensis]|uniref:Major facilitator superfamily (MFS) profile domain-containing protein n=1 Tax=Aspergillus nanangensis TaxID=2582783 RepID=A0AAD4CLQ8_ASPNN|nr:hypothetical protein FE257_008218 [Aspergillus nanangensis]